MSETEWMGVDLTKIPRGELEFYPFPSQYGYCMKWTQHIAYPQAIKRVATDAWRDSQAYPGGPVGIEFPLYTLATDIEKSWPLTPSMPAPHKGSDSVIGNHRMK